VLPPHGVWVITQRSPFCLGSVLFIAFRDEYISSYRVYVSTRQLTVFKNVSIILVQIVRTTLDAFRCEKFDHLSAQHRAVRALVTVANVAAIGRPKMAYRDVENNS